MKKIILSISFMAIFFAWYVPFAVSDEKADPINSQSESDVPLYISKPIVPTPPDYIVAGSEESSGGSELCGNEIVETGEECDDGNLKDGDGCSADCKKERGVEDNDLAGPGLNCGNGVIEESEECDGNNGCADGVEVCENCVCVKLESPICGNDVLEEGEQCDGNNDTCSSGLVCSRFCQCVSEDLVCGNGVVDRGEDCGEPTLPECGPGKECAECQCVEFGCGFLTCPNDSRCRVEYCKDAEGECVFGDLELIGGLSVEQYASGDVEVPECCARVSYQLSVGFNPCTGEVDTSTYNVQIGTVSRTNEDQCYCGIQEPDGSYVDDNGNTIDCHDTINRNADVQVSSIGDSQPKIRIQCSNCCGDQVATERTLESATSRGPIDCGAVCPDEP